MIRSPTPSCQEQAGQHCRSKVFSPPGFRAHAREHLFTYTASNQGCQESEVCWTRSLLSKADQRKRAPEVRWLTRLVVILRILTAWGRIAIIQLEAAKDSAPDTRSAPLLSRASSNGGRERRVAYSAIAVLPGERMGCDHWGVPGKGLDTGISGTQYLIHLT